MIRFIYTIIDWILHLDHYLGALIQNFGASVYILLFAIIFCETGLVVTPFLPGDSLLFAAGSLAALKMLNVFWLWLILGVAAVLGDTVNYWIGRSAGNWLINKYQGKLINPKYLARTQKFYAKYGTKMILFSRFVPIIRTFAPFVAGLGEMHYATFLTYNIVGGLAWVSLFVWGGYFFGNIPVISENFGLMIIGIIIISLLPVVYEVWKSVTHDKPTTV